MSAQRCLTAWNEPIGRPNCSRSLAYSVDCSAVAPAMPASSAATSTVPRRRSTEASSRWASAPRSDTAVVASGTSGSIEARACGDQAVGADQGGVVVGHHQEQVGAAVVGHPERAVHGGADDGGPVALRFGQRHHQLPGQDATGQVRMAGQRGQPSAQHGGQEGSGRGVGAELGEEQRLLDQRVADAAERLVQAEAEPPEGCAPLPQRPVHHAVGAVERGQGVQVEVPVQLGPDGGDDLVLFGGGQQVHGVGLRSSLVRAGAGQARGRPSTRSPTMLRWMSVVPPPIV